MNSSNTVLTIEQIINDCQTIPFDAGDGKINIQIIFPEYFNQINSDIRRYIINTINKRANEGKLDNIINNND